MMKIRPLAVTISIAVGALWGAYASANSTPLDGVQDSAVVKTADALVVGYFTGIVRTVNEVGVAIDDSGQYVQIAYVSEYQEFRIDKSLAGLDLPTVIEVQSRVDDPQASRGRSWQRPPAMEKVGLALGVLVEASGTRIVVLGPKSFTKEGLGWFQREAAELRRQHLAPRSVSPLPPR